MLRKSGLILVASIIAMASVIVSMVQPTFAQSNTCMPSQCTPTRVLVMTHGSVMIRRCKAV
jgi:hypothetical protein